MAHDLSAPVQGYPTASYEHRDSPEEHHSFLLFVVLTVLASWGVALYLAAITRT